MKTKSNTSSGKKSVKESKVKRDSKQLIEDFSFKELGILILGLVIILGSIIFVPKLWNSFFEEDAKSLDQLHMENYKNPETDDNYIYNGFSFLKIPDPRTSVVFWYTQYENNNKLFNIPFRFGPREVENISIVSVNKMQNRSYNNIYITIDPTDVKGSQRYTALAVSEFVEILSKVKNYPMIAACTRNETQACIDRPIINCSSDGDFLIFYFNETNETLVEIDNNCISVKGEGENLIRSTDKAIYTFLGIV